MGAMLFVALAALLTPLSGAALFLLWPALALAIVAFGYAGAQAAIFQKRPDGDVSLASRWLLAPYRLGARLNILAWTQHLPASVQIADGVHLGRFPRPGELGAFSAVVDMSGELARPTAGIEWRAFPAMDLLPASRPTQNAAALAIEELRGRGPVLVCCALGFQRSAAAVATWLVRSGRAAGPDEAVQMIAACGRRIHLSTEDLS